MIKLVFGSKNKIIKLQKPTFQSLTSLIKQSFADLPIDYSLSYLDTDKDEICLNSDQDLFIMLNSGIKINKIYVKQSLSQVIQITDRIQPSFQIYQHKPEQKQVIQNKILPIIEEKIIQQVVVPDNNRVNEEKKEEKQVIKEQQAKKQQVRSQISEQKELVLELVVSKDQIEEEEEKPVNKSIILNVSQNNQIQITEDVLIEAVKKIMINQQQEAKKRQLKEEKKEVVEQKKEVIEKKEAVQAKKEVAVEEKKILKQEKIEVKQQKKEVEVEKEQVKPQEKQQVKPQIKDQKKWHKKQYSPLKKDNSQLVYHNIICSNCNDEYGIIGVRYQCIFCEHFNLCSVCQQVVAHEHSLLKVKVPKQAVHKDQIISKYKKQIFASSEPLDRHVPSISKGQAHVYIQAGKKMMAQSFQKTQKLMTELFLKLQMSHKNPYEMNKPIAPKKESPRQKVDYLIDFLDISQKDAYTFCSKYHGFTKQQLLNIYVQKRASNAL